MNKIKNSVDIIVPVYNAFDSLKKCVESVIRNTDLSKNNLIIIDDGSTDKKIFDFYSEVEKNKSENIKIYKNKKNLGFVGTVNRGMGLNNINDVLLLNSDTIVTKKWLEKIRDCAYSNDSIATVTPLSNNATICSVPNFVEDNVIPDGFNIDSFANLIETISLKTYPELPTAHGFCMFIKRDVLNIFGLFNLELFGKGYGEENEFCLRVEKYGYKNVLDDSTFIYHSGSASFTDEKRIKIINRHIKIIENLYPGYQESITNFVKTNPLKNIHRNIKFWIDNKEILFSNKKRIMFVMHFEPTIGGVGINTLQIIKSNNNFDFFCFSPNENGEIVVSFYKNGEWKKLWTFIIKNRPDIYSFYNNEIENIFINIIKYLDISLVHFQHVYGLCLSLLEIPNKLNIGSVLSLHDYHFISVSPQLIGNINYKNIKFSSDGKLDAKKIKKLIENDPNNVDLLRVKKFNDVAKKIDLIVSPSSYVKNFYSEIIDSNIKIKVLEHGIDITKSNYFKEKNNNTLNVAFLGVAANHKGLDDILKIIQEKKFEKKIKWFFIGDIPIEAKNRLDLSGICQKNNVIFTGNYKLENLKEILNGYNIDLVLLLSIYPETYSYTLSESVQCNIPVLARNIGALGERVTSNNFGWLFKDYSDLVKKMEYLCKNKKLIVKKSNDLKNKTIKSLETMSIEYNDIYKKIISKYKKDDNLEYKNDCWYFINKNLSLNNYSVNENIPKTLSTAYRFKEKIKSIPILKNVYFGLKRIKNIF